MFLPIFVAICDVQIQPMSSYLPSNQSREYKVAPPDTIWHYLKLSVCVGESQAGIPICSELVLNKTAVLTLFVKSAISAQGER